MKPDDLSRPWLTLGIRLSVFPPTSWEVPADLWQKVVGSLPEGEGSQPQQQVRTQTSTWHRGLLQLATNPLSLVWSTTPAPSPEGAPNFDNWSVREILPKFRELTYPWLSSTDLAIKRIGFGLNGVLSVDDRVEAYTLLNELLKIAVDPKNSSDLFYQINWPIDSRVIGDLRINRLTKWSAPRFRATHIQMIGDDPPQAIPAAESQFAGVDVDVNTPATHSEPLDKEDLGLIYDELIDLALEILEFGEQGRKA